MTTAAEHYAAQRTRDYSGDLAAFDRLYATVHGEMIDWLQIPAGAHVLDAGCGAGGVIMLLATATGGSGSVAALDISPAHLAATRAIVLGGTGGGAPDRRGLGNRSGPPSQERTGGGALDGDRVTYHEGHFPVLPFDGQSFDLVWCSRVIHALPDQLAGVRELHRVLRSGGRVALREGGLRMKFLPMDIGLGEPGLEQRLEALAVRWLADERRSSLPGGVQYPFGWAQMLRDAGFVDVTSRGFLLDLPAPLSDEQLAYLESSLRLWLDDPRYTHLPGPADRETIVTLTDPESPHALRRRQDLHALAVSTVYVGRKP